MGFFMASILGRIGTMLGATNRFSERTTFMRSHDLAEHLLTALRHPAEAQRALPLNRRLYLTLRAAILDNTLSGGSQLPSTRDLARDLELSRNTVLSAINQLISEGYLTARRGSGTFVSDTLPDARPRGTPFSTKVREPRLIDPTHRALSRRGQQITGNPGSRDFEVQPFVPGTMDLADFPIQVWHKLQNKYWRYLQRDLLDYGQEGGYLPLRQALARYLTLSRSVRVEPEQILITAGTQQAIDLAARLLTDHGDTAWVENPCYWGARRALESAGLKLHAVPVDGEGLNPSAGDWQTRPRLIYTTPSHQYPLGCVMSVARRRAVLEFAARQRCWIFEDDYDSEFRYTGQPFASLQGLDAHAQVIYSGTFSKVMYPGMRLGYMVVPPDLVDAFRTGLYDLFRPGQLILQAALTDFINEGHFNTLIRKLRVSYRSKRDQIQDALRRRLGSAVAVQGNDSGLHLCLTFPRHRGVDDVQLSEWCGQRGLQVRPLSRYYLTAPVQQGLVLGYAYVPANRVPEWATRLADTLAEQLAENTAQARQ